MERAKSEMVLASFFKLYILADDIDNIRFGSDLR